MPKAKTSNNNRTEEQDRLAQLFLNQTAGQIHEFDCKTLGEKWWIRIASEYEKSQWETDTVSTEDARPVRERLLDAKARLVVKLSVTKDGLPVFTTDHIPQLMQTNSAVVGEIYDEATRVCGLNRRDLESLVKN